MTDEVANGVRRALSPISSRPHDIPRLLQDLMAEGAGSEAVASSREAIELAILSALVVASSDMHRLTYHHMRPSMIQAGDIPLKPLLEFTTTRVAMINRRRNDVPYLRSDSEKLRNFALAWEETELTASLRTNPNADDACRYNPAAWQRELLESLRVAVGKGANLVCFGEFDYPPSFDRERPEDQFQADVKDTLRLGAQPAAVVLGSSHRRKVVEGRAVFSGNIKEYKVENVAQIFFSDIVTRLLTEDAIANPKEVWKVTPASRVGERLSRPSNIDLYGFSAIFGKVSVLVCSDAYDPTIILELFSRSKNPDEKPDFIVVPAYNASPRFPEVCQALSALTNCIVVLVDAHQSLGETNDNCDKSQIWICGIPVQEFTGDSWSESTVCEHVETVESDTGTCIDIWDIDLIAYRSFVAKMERIDPTPNFSKVKHGFVRGKGWTTTR
jgi:hypothetical protein